MNQLFKLKTLLYKAMQVKASDIHITYRNHVYVTELRNIKGHLEKYEFNVTSAFIQFLKVKAHIDLLSSLKPQTGQFDLHLGDNYLAIRVAYLKNKQIESIVLRLLNQQKRYELSDLFNKTQYLSVTQLLQKKAGLILFSGTTGSGKTTSLYSCLDYLKDQKIYSIEDPIEVIKEHVVQLQINKQVDFGFNEAIKQILRHDPNIIVIGEIRSLEEAQAALSCSLSGHLVISTIHASSCEITLKRLIDLGCEKELIYDAILAIIYQELQYEAKQDKRYAIYEILERKDIDPIKS